MEKINVAELLKNCPKGMGLDCTMFEGVFLERVDENVEYPIAIRVGKTDVKHLTKEGCWNKYSNAKCVIFPKGKTTWEGFRRPYINGDIVRTKYNGIAILDNRIRDYSEGFRSYCGLFNYGLDVDIVVLPERLATEEEKEELFKAIKDNGYKWNPETKTLEKLIKPKFKDGDIVTSVFQGIVQGTGIFDYEEQSEAWNHACVNHNNEFFTEGYLGYVYNLRLATEEEKAKLFQAIKDNGYKWNAETKILEKLIEPKFKVGDKVRVKNGVSEPRIIDGVFDTFYSLQMIGKIDFTEQDRWELVPNKFDISTLVPFESRVLVRDYDNMIWIPTFWGKHLKDGSNCSYITTNGCYKYCIPYEGNEHLLGKDDDCDEYFKTWK